jgi:putative mRNA 3-end processing factor
MIIDDFLAFKESGLYCRVGDFYLDPKLPVKTAVITHAHGDHACPGNELVYCTPATAAIMQLRLRKNAAKQFKTLDFHQPFYLGAVKITMIAAGHILGSAQILMEYEEVRYLYTGDIKMQDDPTCERIDMVRADVLITETTFANPAVLHPDPVEEIRKLNASNHNVLLGSYSLGKSQRLVNLITEHCPQRSVLLHHSMVGITKLYEDFGFHPGNYAPYNRKLMKFPDKGFVYIVPPLTFDCYFRAKGVLRAFASGWKRLQAQNDLSIYISDHADWNDILKYIEAVKPSEVWTLHGDGEHLRQHFAGVMPVKLLV